MKTSITGALVIGLVSTVGDFIWATWIPRHLPVYGLTHGALLFGFIGLYLGMVAKKPVLGAITGLVTGFLAAGSFYVLAPLIGRSSMLIIWFIVWIALGGLNEYVNGRRAVGRVAITRGLIAAVVFGVAFYLISGIWFPFDPEGWDYAVHFAGWAGAYLPAFAALLGKK